MQLADVDHERAGQGGGVDPPVRGVDLQALLARLDHQQREHAGILVRADALPALFAAGVADELDQGGGAVAEGAVEDVGRTAEGQRPGAQEPPRDRRAPVLPVGEDRPQVGLRLGPEVRPFQAHVDGRSRIIGGCAFGADVDLLAPVDLALGELAAGPGVAAELRTAQHLDAALVVERQREEAGGLRERPRGDVLGDAVADEVEEADVVGGGAQRGAEVRRLGVAPVELGHVEDGEAGRPRRSCHLPGYLPARRHGPVLRSARTVRNAAQAAP